MAAECNLENTFIKFESDYKKNKRKKLNRVEDKIFKDIHVMFLIVQQMVLFLIIKNYQIHPSSIWIIMLL